MKGFFSVLLVLFVCFSVLNFDLIKDQGFDMGDYFLNGIQAVGAFPLPDLPVMPDMDWSVNFTFSDVGSSEGFDIWHLGEYLSKIFEEIGKLFSNIWEIVVVFLKLLWSTVTWIISVIGWIFNIAGVFFGINPTMEVIEA